MFSKYLAAINYLTSTHCQHTAYGAEQTKEAELEKVKAGGPDERLHCTRQLQANANGCTHLCREGTRHRKSVMIDPWARGFQLLRA